MKIYYLTFLLTGLSMTTFAQLKNNSIKPKKENLPIGFYNQATNPKNGAKSNYRTAQTCATDTIQYIRQKQFIKEDAGINFLFTVNADGRPSTVGQYFSCPQPMTISGFYFMAVKVDTADPTPVNVYCSIFNASPDSTILVKLGRTLEGQLATVTVPVDTTGLFSRIQIRKAVFATPVTVNQPFIVAITNPSTVDVVAMVTTDYSDSADGKPRIPDGFQEWLLSVTGRITGPTLTSFSSYDFGIDGDLLVQPFIKYDVTADFSLNKTTVFVGEDLTITNLSSPVINDYFYNFASFIGQDSISYYWNFGDSIQGVPSRLRNIGAKTFTKKYSTPGTYTITLSDSLYGYYQDCGSSKSLQVTVLADPQAVNKAYEAHGINLYPNPSDGAFVLTFDKNNHAAYEMVISDITGTEILRSKLSQEQSFKFQLKDRPKGMYLMKLVNEQEIIVKQLIIQ